MTNPSISFEFFPPKSENLENGLFEAMAELAKLNPQYMTVTYGAGGSTKDGTLKTLQRACKEFDIPFASHLTFLSTTKPDLDEYIDNLWSAGVKHLVALRGDLPKGASFDDFTGSEYYDYTSNFVKALLEKYPFEISVGAYPEKHPDALSLEADIEALKLKCEAGATRAITQFFFDNNLYYDFRERCEKAGITTPICPGILPVHDFASMCNFAKKCNTSVPEWMVKEFEGFELKPDEAKKIATEILIEQTQDLAKNGVEHIHFYTLNKASITKEACEALVK